MLKINYVLEGYSKGEEIYESFSGPYLQIGIHAALPKQIKSYQLLEEKSKKEYSSVLGSIGVIMGYGIALGIDGKTTKEYHISIEWKDGTKSLILLSESYYKIFIQSMS